MKTQLFQSTHPTRGCDQRAPAEQVSVCNFNPRTPRGGATHSTRVEIIRQRFQSTHPTRGCDAGGLLHAPRPGHFNPRTPRGGATMTAWNYPPQLLFQSTHPTRGCDDGSPIQQCGITISIHAPHEGVRPECRQVPNSWRKFQSTHPTRGCDRNML